LKERPAGDGVGDFEVGDFGEQDTHGIASLDVFRFLARGRLGEGEEDGIPDGERFAGGHRDDGPASQTSLDFRDSLFVRGIAVHSVACHRVDVPLDTLVVARTAKGPPHTREWFGGRPGRGSRSGRDHGLNQNDPGERASHQSTRK